MVGTGATVIQMNEFNVHIIDWGSWRFSIVCGQQVISMPDTIYTIKDTEDSEDSAVVVVTVGDDLTKDISFI